MVIIGGREESRVVCSNNPKISVDDHSAMDSIAEYGGGGGGGGHEQSSCHLTNIIKKNKKKETNIPNFYMFLICR